MKQFFKKSLIKILQPVNSRIGFTLKDGSSDVQVINKNLLLHNFFSILAQTQFNPGHIVDVGANHGTWTQKALQYFPEAYYSLLEPQYWLADSLKELLSEKIRFYPIGAGSESGSFRFTIVNRDDSCSFRYTKEQAVKKGFQQLDLPVERLDEFLISRSLPVPDIIKIDAEGLDLEVLKGAGPYLGKTEVFLVEAAVNNLQLNNTVLKVIEFMDNKGYRLFDLTDINRPFKPSVLWLVELAFIKKDGFVSHNVNILT
ncbi:MAG TPA: FkbM family methyltransferase [Candidatus Babeliaceae bacterium]|nr:FkbM family methyltransferase [Candidatus Babeliaceae bacterium]